MELVLFSCSIFYYLIKIKLLDIHRDITRPVNRLELWAARSSSSFLSCSRFLTRNIPLPWFKPLGLQIHVSPARKNKISVTWNRLDKKKVNKHKHSVSHFQKLHVDRVSEMSPNLFRQKAALLLLTTNDLRSLDDLHLPSANDQWTIPLLAPRFVRRHASYVERNRLHSLPDDGRRASPET